jgi:uncharacterized delta-60 repeat protein
MNRQHRHARSRQPVAPRTRRPATPALESLDRRLLLSTAAAAPVFGDVETDFPELSQETARRAARQSDGRIVVLVTETEPGTRSLLARYTATGQLDTTFGAGGSVLLPFPVGTFAVRPDNKIVVAGFAVDNSDPNNLVLARYTAGGQVDTTFGGGDGHVEQRLFGDRNVGNRDVARLLVRPDNRMVLAGQTFQDAEWDFALQAFTAAGAVDTSFGTAGVVTTDVGRDKVNDAVLTPDGKVVAVGQADYSDSHHPFSGMDFEVARYTAAGQPDLTFGGGDGVLTTSFGSFPQHIPWTEPEHDSYDTADAVAVDSAGNITVAGRSYDPTDQDPTFLAIARYKANGDLDPTFSPGGLEGSGKLWAYFGLPGQTHDLALLPGGRILVSGTVGGHDGPDFGLARLNPDGSFDISFGVAGQLQANAGGDNIAYDLLTLPDDSALLVGGALDLGEPSGTPPDGPVALVSFSTLYRPFGTTPIQLPGVVQLENYDRGGEGTAFHDTDAVNQGGAYRTESADVQAILATAGGGYALAFARAGEWVEYTVNTAQAGDYDLAIRLASLKGGGRFGFSVDGMFGTSQSAAPATGDWQRYVSLKLSPPIHLTAGVHVLRLNMDANDATGYVANFDRLDITRRNEPYNGGVGVGPGQLIQAENFDKGGEGAAYHDTEPANLGPPADNYRPADGVDIEPAAGTGGGYNVGYARAGEWLEYGLSASYGSTYALDVRLASLRAGGTFHVDLDGQRVASFTAPATGSWQTYATLTSAKSIYVPYGVHTLRLTMDPNNSTGYVANFDWLRLHQ